MRKTVTRHFFEDCGHGWLRVPRKDLEYLGISGKITHYSYVKGDNVFAEEDCDASAYLDACEAKGIKVNIKHHHTDRSSKIRSYASYKA